MSDQPPSMPPPPTPPTHDGAGGYGGYGYPAYDPVEAFRYGWRKFKENAGAFVLMGLLTVVAVGLLSGIGGIFSGAFDRSGDGASYGFSVGVGAGFSFVGTVFNILANIAGVFLTAALARGALDATEGRKVEIGAMFTRWDAGQVLILAILVGIGTMVGALLCVLPGIAFAFFTWYANYFVVSEGQSSIDAIKSSFRFTADHIGNMLLLLLLSVLVCIVGACACGVGLLVAIPVSTIAAAYTFKVLRDHPVAP
jgi:uncharacterized membrane protein